MAMHVIFPGPRTTVQDEGRYGYQNMGFTPGGFMDRDASRMANVLVGNEEGEALLEFCLVGPILCFDEQVNLSVCGGDFSLEVGEKVYPACQAVHVPSGVRVRALTGQAGVYGSLAISGGLAIPKVMGSYSTLLRCQLGGYQGRTLLAGDIIPLRSPEKGREDLSWRRGIGSEKEKKESEGVVIRVIPGPQEERFTQRGMETFYGSRYIITGQSDRMGYRLSGPLVEAKEGYDILSDGIAMGSIQISGNGEPIVMMADRQTTGGYAKIANVISADLPLFAQLRPGQGVEFVPVSVQEAQRVLREKEEGFREFVRLLRQEETERREKKKWQGSFHRKKETGKGLPEKGKRDKEKGKEEKDARKEKEKGRESLHRSMGRRSSKDSWKRGGKRWQR